MRWFFAVAAATVALSTPASPQAAGATDGSALTVWLMTMGQGDPVWERFGHNAVRIRDASRGTDVTYNWGVFDFEDPAFIVRFVTGETRYWAEGYDTRLVVGATRRENRSVWVQELNLTPAQRVAVRDFIEWNVREENKFYRYDYYLDNCSTRVRDLLDKALGGQIRQATASRLTTTTFRWHTRRLLQEQLPLYTGIEIALGEPADRPISTWEEMFLPTRMQASFRELHVQDAQGALVPLVKNEEQLFAAARDAEPATVPDRRLVFLAAGIAVALVLILLARAATRGARAARGVLVTTIVIWSVLAAVLGVVLVVAWTATRHTFWARNENLLLLSPLSLLLAISLPGAFAPSRRATVARATATILAGCAALALALKTAPVFGQTNGEIIALILPIALAISWSVGMLTARTRAGTTA